MARTALSVITTSKSGTIVPAAAAVDAVNGNSFVNTGREEITITNGSGSTITVTFITTLTYQGFAIADQIGTVAAGVTTSFGPFDTALFNDPTDGTVGVDYTSGTTVTARVKKLGTI